MEWWIWILAGIAMSFAEIALTPGVFVLLFFGISALFVGILVGIGIGGPFWLQGAIFVVIAISLLALFRGKARKLMGLRGWQMDFDSVVGGVAISRAEIQPGDTGKAEFRGSTWNVVNTGGSVLYPGDQCRIEQLNGLVLSVKSEKE